MSASKCIGYISGHPGAFGFCAFLAPHKNTLNPVNKKAGLSLSPFQTSIGVGAHATLDTEHLISDTRAALADTVTTLQYSDEWFI